jgi:predicted PhzF superfamily epimerase YddE/YHI9
MVYAPFRGFASVATPASAYVILNRLQAGFQTVRFETRLSGALTVSKERERFAMNFPAMFGDNCAHSPEALIQGLGPGPRPSKLLPVNSPRFAVCETQAAIQTSVLIPSGCRNFILYCRGNGSGEDSDFVSRDFAPGYGIPEDPVTGSAHCALTPCTHTLLGGASGQNTSLCTAGVGVRW